MVAVTLWGRYDVGRFLSQYGAIDGQESLLAFKTLVRRNMWIAIASLLIGFGYVITGALLSWQLGIRGVLIVLAVSVPLFLSAQSTRKVEARARALPCADDRLEGDYRKVGHAWTSKPFPDF